MVPNDRDDLKRVTLRAERIVLICIQVAYLGSAVLGALGTYLFFDHYDTSPTLAVLIAILMGVMTYAVLTSFASAAINILPRLGSSNAVVAGAVALFALFAILAISGTSNAVFLAHSEARAIEQQKTLGSAEAAFGAAQATLRQLEQIVPTLATGKQTAAMLKRHEETRGQTGAGRGPVYTEILVQESRLAGAEDGIREVVKNADAKVRAGQQILESLRTSLSDPELTRRERQRAMENALTRLSSIVIELRQQVPLASLKATATLLTTPSVPPALSPNAEVRRVQEETFRRIHREFEPIGAALRQAVTDLEDRLPKPVPTYRHLSPTAVVFKHAGELAWVIALGYALDLLPYLGLGLILLAHAQRREDTRPAPENPPAEDNQKRQDDEDDNDRPTPPSRRVSYVAKARR